MAAAIAPSAPAGTPSRTVSAAAVRRTEPANRFDRLLRRARLEQQLHVGLARDHQCQSLAHHRADVGEDDLDQGTGCFAAMGKDLGTAQSPSRDRRRIGGMWPTSKWPFVVRCA